MENVRKWVDIRLVTTRKQLNKLLASPRFKELHIFNKNLIAVSLHKEQVKLNKPIYVGFTVLELSKLLIYDFHYNVILKKYSDKARLLFIDTDSLTYHVRTQDIYQDMKEMQDFYDTSEYPKGHFLYSEVNKKVLGKMKDETMGEPIAEFVSSIPPLSSSNTPGAIFYVK